LPEMIVISRECEDSDDKTETMMKPPRPRMRPPKERMGIYSSMLGPREHGHQGSLLYQFCFDGVL